MQSTIVNFVLVAIGGAIGSTARYAVAIFFSRYGFQFPMETFIVNILGCFLLGIVSQIAVKNELLSPEIRLFMAAGFCGGFTTFSTFMLEIANLLEYHKIIIAALYIGASSVGGLLSVLAGIWLVKLWV